MTAPNFCRNLGVVKSVGGGRCKWCSPFAPGQRGRGSGAMAGSTDAILSFAAIAGVFYLLGLLVQMIEHGINSQVRGKKIKPDPFKSMQDGQGWNWDWVFVFDVRDEDWAGTQGEEGKEKNDLQRKMTIQQIALDVKNADLEYKIYKSRFYDKVFMKIRANRERLCAMGDQLDYKLKLDENDIKERMMKGRLDPLKVGLVL